MIAAVMQEPESADESRQPPARPDAMRRCIVTGETRPKAELIRFVLGPENRVVPDLAGALPGRGAWVTADRGTLERAAKTAFSRAFEAPAQVPADFVGTVERLLARRCVDRLRLSRRAGTLAAGAAAVERWLRADRVAMLLVAFDAGKRHRDRLRTAKAPVLRALSADELGSVFGWTSVGQLAVARGGFAEGIAADLHRLAGFRDGPARLM